MNLKGKLSTNLSLTGKQAVAGGSGGSGGPTTWDNVSNKPFSTVDTAGGLTIYDNTLGIDTLDTIATIDYVDQQIASIPTPDIGWSDVQNKPFNTVGEGLEINNGSLKEAVPLYEETSSEEQTSTAEGYPYRQETSHYTDTFIWYEDRRLPMIPDATSIPQFEFGYEYDDGGNPTWASYSSSSLTPSDFLNGFSATDSSGNQWTISLHDYQLRFEKGSNVETYELSVSIEIYVDGEGNYNVSGTALRESWSEYTDSFIYPDDRLISMLIGASNVIMEFTYWDGSQDQTLYVNHLDLTDTSSDYEQDGLHWNIYADDWSIYFNCTNGLPANAGTSATVQFTYTHTVETTTVHKLPAKYVPIDNNTIQVDWNGNLYANVPPSGVQSVSYSNILGEGTTVGYLNVDYNSYEILAPAGGTSTVGWDDIQNKPTFATVATSGSYNDLSNKPTIPTVPTNVSDFNNDAGYITDSALDGYATEQYVDDAIADIPAPTVEIDNKSIIKNQDDELQTAVPLYSEEITEVHNTIRQWDSKYNNYGSTDSDYVTYCKNNTISNASTYYTVFVNYTYNGNDYTVSSKVNNIKGNSDNVDQSSDMWSAGFHTIRLVDYYISGVNHDCWMWCSNQTYTINWVMIKEVPYDETYSSSDISFTYTEYHQVPGEYLPIKVTPKQSSGQEVGTIEIDGNSTTLYAPNVSIGYGLKNVNGTIMLNSELNSFGPVDFGLQSQEQYLRLLTGTVTNYTGGGIIKTASTDSANDIKMTTWPKLYFDNSSTRREKWFCTNFITDRNYRKVHTITPYYKWYDNRWFGPYYISGIFIGEYDASATPTYNIRVEGWESILDSITWNASSNRYDFLLKEDITISPSQTSVPFSFIFYQGRDNIPDPQKINSYFLPLDNSTIVRDSDGNIKTAIPAPPTTDGTYTLQVVVSNGEPTYSWI